MNLRRTLPSAVALALCAVALPIASAAAQPTEQLRWFGDASSATGAALGSGACDVNGDGYDDAIVGAWFWDKAPTNNIGAAYVLFGGRDAQGGDLNTPGEAGAARIDGPSVANSFVGFGVACLGDVNGDDIDDLGISHYIEEKAYVVLGAEQFGSVDLGLLGDRGFEIRGATDPASDYNVGNVMAPAGDLNGDGLDDIAVAGIVADTRGRTNNGRVWVVAGREDVGNVDVIAPEAGDVLQTIDGAGSEDRLGQMAPAGDVNGDGTDDLVLGAYTATPWGTAAPVAGSAWVVWGGSGAEIDLAAIGEDGFAIRGPQRGRDRLGISVSGAGDVNGDGLDDLIVGGDGVYNAATGQRPGSAWVVFGADSNETVLTATDPSATAVYDCVDDDANDTCDPGEIAPRGYWIAGADSDPGNGSESTGYSLAGIGDVNGDEVPDFAIGAYGYDPQDPAEPASRMTGAGAVWVVHGKPSTTTQQLAELEAPDGYRIDGLAGGDRFGRQVAALGDFDGNGFADLAAGGDFAERPLGAQTPRAQAGEVMVALLGALSTETTLENSTAGPVGVGEAFELTARVNRPVAGGAVADTGSVAFTANGQPITGCDEVALDAGGTARCTASLAAAGSYSLRATYSGAEGLASSIAEPVELTVNAPPDPPEEPPTGTGGPDRLIGTSDADLLRGRAGEDELRGRGGDDELRGGKGADELRGEGGDDRVFGDSGSDVLFGGTGDDLLDGGRGADRIRCGAGDDTVEAQRNDDVHRSCERVIR